MINSSQITNIKRTNILKVRQKNRHIEKILNQYLILNHKGI